MDNQHREIRGYRDLSREEIELINELKSYGEASGDLIAQLRAIQGVDPRWVSIGETHLQQGVMALVRAVARPESF